MKTRKFIIQSILLVVIIVLLSHPEWLPLSETTSYTMKELISTYFGGTVVSVTFAQILAVVLMVCMFSTDIYHQIRYTKKKPHTDSSFFGT